MYSRFLRYFLFFMAFFYVYALAADENITITTFYPSPRGVYKEIRLYPQDSEPSACTSANDGSIYYNNVDNKIYNCKETAPATYEWKPFGSGKVYVKGGLSCVTGDTLLAHASDSQTCRGGSIGCGTSNCNGSSCTTAGHGWDFVNPPSSITCGYSVPVCHIDEYGSATCSTGGASCRSIDWVLCESSVF